MSYDFFKKNRVDPKQKKKCDAGGHGVASPSALPFHFMGQAH